MILEALTHLGSFGLVPPFLLPSAAFPLAPPSRTPVFAIFPAFLLLSSAFLSTLALLEC